MCKVDHGWRPNIDGRRNAPIIVRFGKVGQNLNSIQGATVTGNTGLDPQDGLVEFWVTPFCLKALVYYFLYDLLFCEF